MFHQNKSFWHYFSNSEKNPKNLKYITALGGNVDFNTKTWYNTLAIMTNDPFKSGFLWVLKQLAKLEMSKHKNALVIGITGSSGKTTTKELLVALLAPFFKHRLKFTKRGNSETGIPFEILDIPVKKYPYWKYPLILLQALGTVLLTRKKFDIFVVEYGIDSPQNPGNMEYLLSIIRPDISILLSITAAHGERFEAFIDPATPPSKRVIAIQRLIAEEKAKLLTATKTPSHAFVTKQAAQFLPAEKLHHWTVLEASDSTFHLDSLYNTSEGCTISVQLPDGLVNTVIPGVALSNAAKSNLQFGLRVLSLLKKNLRVALKKLPEHFKPEPGRSSLLPGEKNTLILDSSYNANPLAAIELFGIVKELAKKGKRKKVIVLGDFRELGEQSEALYKTVIKEASAVADTLVLTNNLMKTYGIPAAEENGFVHNQNLYWFENGRQLAFHILEVVEENSVVLFEGSQDTVFLEYAVKELCAQKEQQYIEKNIPRMTPDWISMK